MKGEADAPPQTRYCNCVNGRRWTGAQGAAVAPFDANHLTLPPDPGTVFSVAQGARRWCCTTCGFLLAPSFDPLLDKTYAPIGILDTAADHTPHPRSYVASQLPWLHLSENLPRIDAKAADARNVTGDGA
ncbi:MAG: GFA family protein [Marinibacterium sp.]|nr:GFA family protein [Marinibacterium sp.]